MKPVFQPASMQAFRCSPGIGTAGAGPEDEGSCRRLRPVAIAGAGTVGGLCACSPSASDASASPGPLTLM
jgi:hypothetical protein